MLKIIRTAVILAFYLTLHFSVRGSCISIPGGDVKTLLQLGSSFYTVVTEARVDLDSSLVYYSRLKHFSRAPLIAENLVSPDSQSNIRWINDDNPMSAQKQLTYLHGAQHAKLLLLIGSYYSFHPGFEKRYIDSGIYFLKLAKKEFDTEKLTIWSAQSSCMLGKCYLKAGNIPTAMTYFQQITKNRKLWDDKRLQAKAWNYLGTYSPFRPNTINSRINALKTALSLYQQLGDKSNQINVLMNLSYLNFAGKNISRAQETAFKSLTIQNAIGFSFTHYSTDMLSLISSVTGDYIHEIAYALASIKTAEAAKDSLGLPYFYERMGDSFSGNFKTHEYSKQWFRKSFDQFQKKGGDTQIYRMLNYLVYNNSDPALNSQLINTIHKLLANRPPTNTIDLQDAYIALADCYQNLRQYRQTGLYLSKAEKLLKPNQLIRGDMRNVVLNYRLANYYYVIQQQTKCRKYCLQVIADPSARINSPTYLLDAYWILHQIDSASGNFQLSIHYLRKYADLQDTLHRVLSKSNPPDQIDIANLIAHRQEQRFADRPITRKIVLGLLSLAIPLTLLFLIILTGYHRRGLYRIRRQKNEINQKNLLLKDAADEKDKLLQSKERLLKEIHHRVQNNMQIVIDLLGNQSAYLSDKFALQAIGQSQSRMKAISLIHQSLDQAEGSEFVEMSGYMVEMTRYLTVLYDPQKKITFKMRLEVLMLDLSKAVPLGLLFNEIITNCFTHAFLGQEEGVIAIILRKRSDELVQIQIKDNGSGIACDFDIENSPTLGINLIKGLSHQIDAHLTFVNAQGLCVQIEFDKYG